jgi:MFS-type transporter involved in bile tolerance (Atg22 family)
MVGFPAKAFGFYMLVQYATAQTAEASLSLISKFTDNAAYAVVACQVCVCHCHSMYMHVLHELTIANCTL